MEERNNPHTEGQMLYMFIFWFSQWQTDWGHRAFPVKNRPGLWSYDLISSLLPHPLVFCFFSPLYTFPHLNQTNISKCLRPVSSFVHCSVHCTSVFLPFDCIVSMTTTTCAKQRNDFFRSMCQTTHTDCRVQLTSLSRLSFPPISVDMAALILIERLMANSLLKSLSACVCFIFYFLI